MGSVPIRPSYENILLNALQFINDVALKDENSEESSEPILFRLSVGENFFVTFGNMAYINISNDGNRLVGPLGLKKAEQELIKRRYKYSYNNQ